MTKENPDWLLLGCLVFLIAAVAVLLSSCADEPCEDDTYRCFDNAVEVCHDGEWELHMVCGEDVCCDLGSCVGCFPACEL